MEEREISFLFSDVAGFAAMTEAFGDRRACRIMARHHRIVRRACGRAGGRELELRGDGFLLAFKRPDRAISCAVEIQRELERDRSRHRDERVHVRMGLYAGPALRTGEHYFGRSLVVASRLADLARPDEILAADSIADSVISPQSRGSAVRFGMLRWTRLRGLRGFVRYRRVHWGQSLLPALPEIAFPNPFAAAAAVVGWFAEQLAPRPSSPES